MVELFCFFRGLCFKSQGLYPKIKNNIVLKIDYGNGTSTTELVSGWDGLCESGGRVSGYEALYKTQKGLLAGQIKPNKVAFKDEEPIL
jgi:hypothetical protein